MKNKFKFFLVALTATAMMFSACKKDDEKNEPEVTPTPVVEEPSEEEVDAKLEKFDISNSQFGVTKTTGITRCNDNSLFNFDTWQLIFVKD